MSRRLYPAEVPGGLSLIVDFTAEFDEPAGVRDAARYLAVPLLDGSLPTAADYLELVDGIAGVEGDVLLHCAAGHGRSATVGAGVLLRRGVARTADEAIAMLDHARPTAQLDEAQKRMVRRVPAGAAPAATAQAGAGRPAR